MLGVVGFLIAATVIAVFVWSGQKTYTMVNPLQLKAFTTGYALLAFAMVFWATIVLLDDGDVTRKLMLVSDTLLLLGTACMLVVIVRTISTPFLTLLGGLVATLTTYRAYTLPSTAYIHDGLLYFNLQGSSRLFIVGMFAFIWLPAAMIIADQIANISLLAKRRLSLQAYFIVLVALLAMFSKAQRPAAIILLFAMIILVFLLMVVFNLSLKNARVAEAKRSHAHATKRTATN